MLAPLLAAVLVTSLGGINAQGMRPLYYLRFAGYAVLFVAVAATLREPQLRHRLQGAAAGGIFKEARQIFAGRPALWRWIAVSTLSALPMAMF